MEVQIYNNLLCDNYLASTKQESHRILFVAVSTVKKSEEFEDKDKQISPPLAHSYFDSLVFPPVNQKIKVRLRGGQYHSFGICFDLTALEELCLGAQTDVSEILAAKVNQLPYSIKNSN